jgi:dienelactone hydrolase
VKPEVSEETVELIDSDRPVVHPDGRVLTKVRPLTCHVHTPAAPAGAVPVVVFCHGFTGHPRKFRSLLQAWAASGLVVIAPVFPLTSDEGVAEPVLDDVAQQPADVRFVLDQLEASRLGRAADASRIGVGGFSLGAITALAVGFGRSERDGRVGAVAAFAGRAPEFDVLEPARLPLLMGHGTDDSVVAYADGHAAFEAAKGPKVWLGIDGGGHHEVFEDAYDRPRFVDERSVAFWRRFLLRDRAAQRALLRPARKRDRLVLHADVAAP